MIDEVPRAFAISDIQFERAEMQMIRWMCGVSIKTSEELRNLFGVEPITTVIRSGRLRWYGHVTRVSDEDCLWSIELKEEDRLEDQEGRG